VGTGSPFPAVEIKGRPVRISQVNNSLIFPGLALGILLSRARRVTDGMIKAAAKALASLSPSRRYKKRRCCCRRSPSRARWRLWFQKPWRDRR